MEGKTQLVDGSGLKLARAGNVQWNQIKIQGPAMPDSLVAPKKGGSGFTSRLFCFGLHVPSLPV